MIGCTAVAQACSPREHYASHHSPILQSKPEVQVASLGAHSQLGLERDLNPGRPAPASMLHAFTLRGPGRARPVQAPWGACGGCRVTGIPVICLHSEDLASPDFFPDFTARLIGMLRTKPLRFHAR